MRARYRLRRAFAAAVALVVLAGIGVGGYFTGRAVLVDEGGGATPASQAAAPAPIPRVIVREAQSQAPADLGFPAVATQNTTRVGGADSVADAAGVALAVHPSAGGVPAPSAVTLVPDDAWQDGVAAASLTAPPVGAPILIGGSDSLPSTTSDALQALAPTGSSASGGKQLFTVGHVAPANGLKTQKVTGASPAALAAAVARLRERLTDVKPAHIVVASLDDPAFAMPAASWAARSGDPVLFAGNGPPPVATLKALHHYAGVPVYVLGPPSAVSSQAFKVIHKVAPSAQRVSGADPVANAIALARYSSGNFGWGINDPGHALVIASATRPLDAAAGAALSASGTWGPLLLTTGPDTVPAALRSYLLDLKPGYVSDPTRAVTNHAWLIGDEGAISVPLQARLDDLLELVEVRSGATGEPGPLGP